MKTELRILDSALVLLVVYLQMKYGCYAMDIILPCKIKSVAKDKKLVRSEQF